MYALLQVDWNDAMVKKKADAYLKYFLNEALKLESSNHPISSSELKSPVILGIAVDRIVYVCRSESESCLSSRQLIMSRAAY